MPQANQSVESHGPPALAGPVDMALVRTAILGVNAWAVLLAVPMLAAGPRSWAALGWTTPPLVALAAGLGLLARRGALGVWLLLAAYPTLSAGVAAMLPRLCSRAVYSEAGLLMGAAALIGFGASAASVAGRPRALRTSSARPLDDVAPLRPKSTRRRLRWALLGVGTLGATLVALVAPDVGDRAGYAAHWGEAAPEAAVLASAVAGALGCAVLALFIGPSLRASRVRPPSARRVTRRVIALLAAAVAGVALYVFYAAGPR